MRENRITAIGNDLYSPNSRSFLNPFLHFLFKTRSSPPASRKGDAASSCSSTSSIASFSLPLSLFPVFSSIFSRFSISLSLSKQFEKFLVRYTFPRAEIVLSRKSCSSSTLSPSSPIPSFSFLLRASRLCVTTRANSKVWRELCTSVTRCTDTSHSYVTTREKAFS